MSKEIRRFPRSPKDLSGFHSFEEFESAPPITFAIEGFLQNDAATLIGGLSEHGKTLILLSMVKALFSKPGTKLWGHFTVNEQASRVIYLIPESGITPFKHRLKLFGLYRYVEAGLLLVRTLSKGPAPKLDDEALLRVAAHAHVFLDTAIRFSEGDESSASDNDTGLAKYIFGLLYARARTVVGAHHAPKSFANQNVMTLENILRGSGDIGAMLATAWGVRQLDRQRNVLHIENVKARDFLKPPCGPFQLIGRPYITASCDFRIHKKPGECGSLAQELHSKAGQESKRTKRKNEGVAHVAQLIEKHGEEITDTEIIKRFKENRWDPLKPATARKYRSLARLLKKNR